MVGENAIYLTNLPSSPMYEKSYTHPKPIQYSIMTPKSDFLFTASVDGSVRLWKKFPTGVEFAKHYYSHKGRIVSLCCSYDGNFVASVGEDKTVKVYDVELIDMTRIIKLEFTPGTAAWVYNSPMKSYVNGQRMD